MRLIIAGSRTLQITDDELEPKIFDAVGSWDDLIIIEGGALGIDRCARYFAQNNGIAYKTMDADWDDLTHPDAVIKTNKFGKKYDALAGHRRNQEMAAEGDVLLLIWNGTSTGSSDMRRRMKRLNKPIYEVIIT